MEEMEEEMEGKGTKNPHILTAWDGLKAGIPLLIGYLPAAAAFGVLSRNLGFSFLHTQLFSLMVFAGASQFMAINLIAVGMGAGQVVLATFLINLRHLLMSASLSHRLGFVGRFKTPFLAFGVTDEVFSVAMTRREPLTTTFLLTLQMTAYAAWNGGTFLGFLVGDFLPESIQASLGIALYALFASILVPEMRRSRQVLVLSLAAGALHTGLKWLEVLPSGWELMTVIVLVAWVGTYWNPKPDSNGVTGLPESVRSGERS